MAKKFIKISEVKLGDTIKSTFKAGDIKVTREGVVSRISPHSLYTKEDYSFGPSSNMSIQLLDRPKPVIVLPTGQNAVVSYKHSSCVWVGVLTGEHWVFTAKHDLGKTGPAYSFTRKPATAAELLANREDYTVHFAGITK